jgi:sulfite exporter TauE/SafE
MDAPFAGAMTALWLGVLTSISPCPLATNIAAVSYIGKKVGSIPGVLLSGALYTAGRMLAYCVMGAGAVEGLLSVPDVSMFLQRNMNRIIGPALLITGLVLLEIIRIPSPRGGLGGRIRERVETGGVWGAGLLGIVFALSLCPVSAALFFGSLIPLAVQQGSPVLLPSVYGVGTGLPVFFFAVLLAFSAGTVGRAFHMLTRFELWARRVTGIVFILVGMYICLNELFPAQMPF